jgi:hypothetical protein
MFHLIFFSINKIKKLLDTNNIILILIFNKYYKLKILFFMFIIKKFKLNELKTKYI